MIARMFSRWIVRAALVGILVLIFGVKGWIGALIGWLIFGYLLWRAFPAVRRDLGFLFRIGKKHYSSVARF